MVAAGTLGRRLAIAIALVVGFALLYGVFVPSLGLSYVSVEVVIALIIGAIALAYFLTQRARAR